MMRPFLVATALYCFFIELSIAGTLTNAVWTPSEACGSRPAMPSINAKSIARYNESIKQINAWQTKVNEYNSCVIKEANADNDVIAKAAKAEQAKFNAEIEKINQDSSNAKATLDKLSP